MWHTLFSVMCNIIQLEIKNPYEHKFEGDPEMTRQNDEEYVLDSRNLVMVMVYINKIDYTIGFNYT